MATHSHTTKPQPPQRVRLATPWYVWTLLVLFILTLAACLIAPTTAQDLFGRFTELFA